jgi:hypothetical protein
MVGGGSLSAMLALALVAAAGAGASSGEFTRAEANADWTLGSIAGSVTWTGCEHSVERPEKPPKPDREEPWEKTPPDPPYCVWIPYVTVGHGWQASECESASRQLPQLGNGVGLVWMGEEREGSGSVVFDRGDVTLDGLPGQLVCLSVTETAQTATEIPCAPPGPPVPPGWHCPYVNASYDHALASALLSAPSSNPAEGSSAGPALSKKRCPRSRPKHSRSQRVKGCGRHHHRHRHKHATRN